MEGGTTQDEASGGVGGKPCVFPKTEQKGIRKGKNKGGFWKIWC